MDLVRNVFIAVHVDDLIMVGSSSQLYEVVSLSASLTQTYVGARFLRHCDAICELPTAPYVTGMLNEHGMKDAKPVVTPAVNRNDDDDEDEEASAEEHRSLRSIVGKSQFLGSAMSRHCFCHKPSGEVPGKTFKVGHHSDGLALSV